MAAEEATPCDSSRFEFVAQIPCRSTPVEDSSEEASAERTIAVSLTLETREGDQLEGSVIWDSALLLARLLMDGSKYPLQFFQPARTFIELGAGCGLAGLVAALRGAWVTFTDMADLLPRLQRNVQRNLWDSAPTLARDMPWAAEAARCSQVAKLDWTALAEDMQSLPATGADGSRIGAPYDVILVADCVYSEPLAQALLETLLALAGPGTVVLLTMRARFAWQAEFLQSLRTWFSGMPLQAEESHKAGLTRAEDILGLRLRRRGGAKEKGAPAAPG